MGGRFLKWMNSVQYLDPNGPHPISIYSINKVIHLTFNYYLFNKLIYQTKTKKKTLVINPSTLQGFGNSKKSKKNFNLFCKPKRVKCLFVD